MLRSAIFGSQMRWLIRRTPGAAKSRSGAIGQLNDGKRRLWQAAKKVGKNRYSAGDIVRKALRVGRVGTRSVDRYVDSFGLLGIQLQISGDEGAVRAGGLAFKGVEEASAFAAVLARQRRWGGTLARTGDGKTIGNVEAKRRGVAVGRIVRQRKPSGGKKQIRVFVADDRGAYAGNRAVFFVGEQARVREGQRDVTARSHGRRQGNEDVERIHRIAAKA